MSTDRATARNRRNQLVLFSALAAAALVVFAVWLAASGGKAPAPAARIDAELAGPGTAEASWVRRSEARIGGIETRLREMEAGNRLLAAENERLRVQLRANAEDARSTIDRQKAVIDELGRRAAAEPSGPATAPTDNRFLPRAGAGSPAAGPGPAPDLAAV